MRKSVLAILPACALLALTPTSARAEFYDAVTDFSTSPALPATSANGVWSYGYSTPGGFVLYDQATQHYFSSTAGHENDAIVGYSTGSDHLPTILANDTGGTYSIGSISNWDPGYLLMHPGAAGALSILRFTAPSAGDWNISASFIGLDSTSTDVHVVQTSGVLATELFTGPVLPQESYSGTLTLGQGDTVDFEVGLGKLTVITTTTALECRSRLPRRNQEPS